MGSMTITRETTGRLTRADLDALPEDGLRHELLDGAFVMTPNPGLLHQRAVLNLGVLLKGLAVPPGLEAMVGPFDVALPTGDLLVPDVLIARVDPLAPRLIAHELVDGEYAVVADVSGEDSWTATAPVEVTVVPADLVR
jgi:hypothetical protein